MTVTGGWGGYNGEKKGKDCEGIYIKDPWTKPKQGRSEDGQWGWGKWGKEVAGKCKQLYLNSKKNKKLKVKKEPLFL